MRIGVVIVAAALAAGVAGCRAEPRAGDVEMAGPIDMTIPVIVDMTAVDLSCPLQPEVCHNGCDDDKNGYTDDDDPACTPQVLVTFAIGPPVQKPAQRMILGTGAPTFQKLNNNDNLLAAGSMLTYDNGTFPNKIFAVHDGSSPSLSLMIGTGAPVETPLSLLSTRDVCIFNHEVIVVEKVAVADVPLGGRLHRYQDDGQTEILPSVSIQGQLSACSSDGKQLYVSRYIGSNPSEIVVLNAGTSGGPPVVTSPVIALPPSIVASGACCASGTGCCTRLLDFAWMKHTKTFLGLFGPGTQPDSSSDSAAVATFALDGGAGPFVDAGTWHGVGEFQP